MLLVVCLAVVATTMVVVLDLALLRHHHLQLRAGAEAAALAGGAELMDRSPLYPALSQSSDTEAEQARLQLAAATVAEAHLQAHWYAGQNTVAGQPIGLLPNPANAPDGDVVAGWVADPLVLGSPMFTWAGDGPFNSLRVRAARLNDRGNPITPWLGRLLGIEGIDLYATARATIDQQVFGFMPVEHLLVPALPLVARLEGHETAWLEQARKEATAGENDRFSVDERTGTVWEAADGIPEVTLVLVRPDDGEANEPSLWCVDFSGAEAGDAALATQIVAGLGPADLAAAGGQLAIGASFPGCSSGGNYAPPIDAIRTSLLAIKGRPRVWMLTSSEAPSGSENPPIFPVVYFAAGCVTDCYNLGADALVVVVQPCLLKTPTALVASGYTSNPWIGKLVLTQ